MLRPSYSSPVDDAQQVQGEAEKAAERYEEDEDEAAMRAALPQSERLDGLLWACPVCTLHNSASIGACAVCGTLRPTEDAAAPPYEHMSEDNSMDTSDWSCSACTFKNECNSEVCVMCGISRSQGPRSMQEEGIDDVRAPDTSHRERLIGGGIDVHDTFGSGLSRRGAG